MPVVINILGGWSRTECAILSRIVKTGGILRDSKPPITDRISSWAAYVWREIQFCISENPKLQCMPIANYYDLIVASEEERRQVADALNQLVDEILEQVPHSEWHGIIRWGMAFGLINPLRGDVRWDSRVEKEES
jgi:hypothetical protein